MTKTLITLFMLMTFGVVMMGYVVPEIWMWEVNNNYPYGKLCDVFNNCSK